jgi:hypothetical protein
MKKLYSFLFILLLSSPLLVQAGTKTWSGSTSTDWATAGNWVGGVLPASGDDVIIPTSPIGGRMPTISANYQVKSITIQTGATLTHSGGTLTVIAGDLNVTGTYAISGGTLITDFDITINSGGLISQSGGTVHLANAIGTAPTDDLIIAANGNYNLSAGNLDTKDFTTTSGSPNGTFSQSGGTIKIYHDFKNNGTFTASNGTIEFSGNGGGGTFPAGVTSSNTQFHHVLIDSGIDPSFGGNAAASFNVSGDWTNNSSSVDIASKASTIIFNGSSSQTIGGSQSTTWRNLTIDKSSGIATVASNQSLSNGNLSITGGTLDLGTYTMNRTGAGGTMTVSNGCSLKMAGNTGGQTGSNFPTNFTSVSLGATSTVEYNGLNSVTQTIYAGVTYGNLSLTNGSGSGAATKNTAANITVNGNLGIYSNSVLSPGAAYTVGGSGTLSGSGEAEVTRTTGTPDFNNQYTITNKSISTMTIDYNATAAQTVNALSYYNLSISGARTTTSVTLTSGTINISGSLIPTATFTSGGYIVTGNTVNFTSSGAQNIPGFTFNNLTVSGGGTKTATGAITVNGAFTLSSTVLTTTSVNLLTLADNATTSGASLTAYVNGPVKKIGNDAFTFPVGKSGTGYMAIGISAPGNTTDAFTAEYMRASATSLGSNITASGLFRVSNCDYWNLNRVTGSSTVDVTLSWNGYTNCNAAAYVTDINTLTVAHFNGTSWDSHGKNSTTGTASSGTITRNGVSSFSPFAIGSSTDYGNPLSVKFSSVKAEKEQVGAKVSWTNMSEINIDHYEVERAAGSDQFVLAGKQTATVNSNSEASYQWIDITPVNGTVLYRVNAVATDGSFVYSSTVKVVADKGTVQLYPNPVSSDQVHIEAGQLAAGLYEMKLYNMNGKQIGQKTITHRGGAINELIELPAVMSPGIYSMHFNGEGLSLKWTFIRR